MPRPPPSSCCRVVAVVQEEEQEEKNALEVEVCEVHCNVGDGWWTGSWQLKFISEGDKAMYHVHLHAMQVAGWKWEQAGAAVEESRQRAARQRRVERLKVSCRWRR